MINCLLFLFDEFGESVTEELLLLLVVIVVVGSPLLLDPESSGEEELQVDEEEPLVVVDSLEGEFEAEFCRCNDARASIVVEVGDDKRALTDFSVFTSSFIGVEGGNVVELSVLVIIIELLLLSNVFRLLLVVVGVVILVVILLMVVGGVVGLGEYIGEVLLNSGWVGEVFDWE